MRTEATTALHTGSVEVGQHRPRCPGGTSGRRRSSCRSRDTGPRRARPAPAATAPRHPPVPPRSRRPARPVGVHDQLDEPVVAGPVDPAAGSSRPPARSPVRTVEPCLPGLLLGHPDRADLGIGERHPGDRVVVGAGAAARRGCRRAAMSAWYMRHVGEGALPGDVADRPHPVARPACARRRSSARAAGSSPIVSRPRSARLVRGRPRPAAARR